MEGGGDDEGDRGGAEVAVDGLEGISEVLSDGEVVDDHGHDSNQ